MRKAFAVNRFVNARRVNLARQPARLNSKAAYPSLLRQCARHPAATSVLMA
jgi:hypothetical protein